MKRVGDGLAELLTHLGASDADRLARRTAVVHTRWKEAVSLVYKDAAQLVLDHVNSVVIKQENGVTILIIYSDDSLIRSDIDNRQEFLKIKLKAAGEDIEVFKILPSTLGMRKRHPFSAGVDESPSYRDQKKASSSPSKPLSSKQLAYIETCAAEVEDDGVRRALSKAMIADIQWKNGSIDKNNL